MKNRRRHCRCIALGTAVFWALVQTATAQFSFVTNNGVITITAYTGSASSVTIPATTNGHPVTAIGNSAFGGNTRVTSVTVPNSVTNIGASAFSGSGLTRITVPGSVISIGSDAFTACGSLTNISVVATNPAYTSQNGVLFDKAQDTLIQFPTALASAGYTVPGNVSTIASDAFYEVTNVSSITMPAGLASINYDAFALCSGLNTVYFSGNAPKVGTDAFYGTDFGTGITAYYHPGTAGWAAFSSALGRSLSALSFWYQPNPLIISFGPSGAHNSLFGFTISWATNVTVVVDVCTNLSHPVWLPLSTNSVTAANGTANFADSQSSTVGARFYSVQLAPSPFEYTTVNGAITITGYTGSDPSVIIPAAMNSYPVVAIGYEALTAPTIALVAIPNSVTNIANEAFYGSGLISIAIPNSVTSIGQSAFGECFNLTAITVSKGNPAYSSQNGVLFDKNQDTLIEFPLGFIANNYIVPSSVTTIAPYAFYQAPGFASVTIPSSVTYIGDDAFAFCSAQENYGLEVYFGGNAPALGNFVFYGAGFQYSGFIANYLPGTTGWDAFSQAAGDWLTAMNFWYLPQPEILNLEPPLGVKNRQLGFTISWATNASVVVDACTNLSNPIWLPISTNSVTADTGTYHFGDPQSSSHSRRFYRLHSP